mmetsp:Transcript_6623/g.14680  ORF Transcript_6623/g.14680 Transcript_6623/m.14680 type:complete len:217 (-) Transcript_6623:951-1601(-)
MERKKCEWPTTIRASCLQNWIWWSSSEMRSDTAALLSTPVIHHCCSTSVTSTSTCLSASMVSLSGQMVASCASERLPHSAPVAIPIVSRPPKFFFSRAFGLSSSAKPFASSSGCSATNAVCIARVSGEDQMALAEIIVCNAAASAGEEESSPFGSSSAAWMAFFKLDAWRNPCSLSGWSTCDTIWSTSRFACASFHLDSPCRMKKTCFCGCTSSIR